MFFILLALVLIVAILVHAKRNNLVVATFKPACMFIAFMAIVLGVFLPTAGYESWEVLEETQLIRIPDEDKYCYIKYYEPGGYGYWYYTKSPYYLGECVETRRVLWIADVGLPIIEQDASYTNPVLVYYKVNPKKNFFTFALLGERRQHVFYIPPGTIAS